MKKTLVTLCALATAVCVAAQAPVVVEPKSQRNATTATTSTSTSSYSSYSRYYDDSYRDRAAKWAIGINFDAGTHNPVWAFGLGVNLQFFATDAFRIEASYNGYIRRHYWASWDVNVNLHYLFEVAEKLELYPLVGVTFNHAQFKVDASDSQDGKAWSHKFGRPGVNIGGGIQYNINEHLFVKGEAYWKYVPSIELDLEEQYAADTETNFGQRAVISAGVGYRF